MGLDVYVGPLSRYYSGNWETILQQYGRQAGVAVEVVRPGQDHPGPVARFFRRLFGRPAAPDPAAAVAAWRTALARHAPGGTVLQWVDQPDGEYFTDKPAWDCYGALALWAAYDETPPASRLSAAADQWSDDPVFKSAALDPSSRYRHLLGNTEMWLPVDFDPPFAAPLLAGDPAVIGSSVRLLAELQALNQNTWRATDADFERWRQEGAEYGAPLETSARFGFAVFHELATLSVAKRLPMKLDY